jgi:phosphohistidine phosphatase SixA
MALMLCFNIENMNINKKSIVNAALYGMLVGSMFSSCSTTSTIYVVRHGEKVAPSGDVALSSEGLQRAETLKDSLAKKNITAVYSTNSKRTQQTAGPTASHFGKPIITYNNGDSLMQVLVNRKNARTLIAGHSNTVPNMLRAVGLQTSFTGNIPDNQYDNLFIVTVKWKKSKTVTLKEVKYGMLSQ